MSGRISKSPHSKTSESSALALYVREFGDDVMPCSRCCRLRIPCKVKGDQSNRCSNCIDAKIVCDGAGVASFRSFLLSFLSVVVVLTFLPVMKNMRERKKLDDEEERAEEALELAMARLARIRKQKRRLKQKGDELFSRGVQSLEESGVLHEESVSISEAHSMGAVDLIDWNAVGLNGFSLPYSSETPEVSSSNG